ncbi:hypothetical protein NDU88_009777 [Pleurodeles waltl]|uniref:Uncharacterized protein n=1 Tax=Pleurodeles waltl TaxID=8319 RepID=A0AAV7PWS4_PLEWA|nr:hypothetical protein NDU88_009777 [Pleurodeles waltl]
MGAGELTLRSIGSTLANQADQLGKFLGAIMELMPSLEVKIDVVALNLGLLRTDHWKLASWVMVLGNKINLFTDLTLQVQKTSSLFLEVKAKLGLPYAHLYLSKLRAVENESVYFFETPRDV